MYASVKRAILCRLTGLSNKDVDSALQSIDGISVNQISSGYGNVGSLRLIGKKKSGQILSTLKKEIPVFPFDLSGTDFEINPAISLSFSGENFRSIDFVPPNGEILDTGVDGTYQEIVYGEGDDEEVLSGYILQKRRKYPGSSDLNWRIQIWARTEGELAEINRAIKSEFGTRGYLDVIQKNGDTISYDAFLDDGIIIGVPDGLMGNGDIAEYNAVFGYTVEAYEDNTDEEIIERSITKRELIVENIVSVGEFVVQNANQKFDIINSANQIIVVADEEYVVA
jgi:hypothetical protein